MNVSLSSRVEFVVELRPYSLVELSGRFGGFGPEFSETFLGLKKMGLVRTVGRGGVNKDFNDLTSGELGPEQTENDGLPSYLVFTFVGLVAVNGYSIVSVPKYISSERDYLGETRLVLRVLAAWHGDSQRIAQQDEEAGVHVSSSLSQMLWLLRDYLARGGYVTSTSVTRLNGDGEINWDRTIATVDPYIGENQPYYLDVYTRQTSADSQNFVRRVYSALLTSVSNSFRDMGLLELFDLPSIHLSDEDVSDFGSRDYVAGRLRAVLGNQFVTRNREIVVDLINYFSSDSEVAALSAYTTFVSTSFHVIWETACSEVFNNDLRKPLEQLNLPVPLSPAYDSTSTLLSLMERPVWTGHDSIGSFHKRADAGLIPDFCSVEGQGDDATLVILDAKYYAISLSRGLPLRGQPGVGDVTKQYLYQLALSSFAADHRISNVVNCFVMPTSAQTVVDVGTTSLAMLENIGLARIQVRLLPTRLVFENFVSNTHCSLSALNLNVLDPE